MKSRLHQQFRLFSRPLLWWGAWMLAGVWVASGASVDLGKLPPAANRPVDFVQDIQPIPSTARAIPWSLQTVRRPPVPTPKTPATTLANPVDAFVLDRLEAKNLSFAPPADRRTFIRRIYLVMHGLPPTPEEVEEFVHDPRSDAVERLVDRVLASPRYGERWGRHWLDVVRFAESNGFETNRERKNAHPYRDYVIKSLNNDLPYDQFIKEQLAGDALGVDAATGFLVAGAYDIVKSPDINLTLMQRQDELADIVNTTGTAFLGLTVGCARCHDHKFDPISQKDYYSIQAVFAGVNFAERPIRHRLDAEEQTELAALQKELGEQKKVFAELREKGTAAQRAGIHGQALRPPVNERLNEETFAAVAAASVRFTILATSGGEPALDELEIYDHDGRNVALASTGAKVNASGTLPGYAIHKLEHLNDGRPGNDRSWISDTAGKGWVQIDLVGNPQIERIVWSRDREGRFKDRLATDYRIEVAQEPGRLELTNSSLPKGLGAPASLPAFPALLPARMPALPEKPDAALTQEPREWKEIASSATRESRGKQDPDAFLQHLSIDDQKSAKALSEQVGQLQAQVSRLTGGPAAWLGTFSQPTNTHRLSRGDPLQPREVVVPDGVTVLGSLGMSVNEREQTRRVRFAEWVASPDNPLTARVLVNRLWHYVFGKGLVDTPSDFGANGATPTNPELLDWLADEFVRSGWSIKHLQKLILTSDTFRQSSVPRADGMAVDAEARLLWRFPPRRLEAESIRDSILATSGALDLRMGGPGFHLQIVEEDNVYRYFPKEDFGADEFRRMVYLTRIRQEQDSVFGSFDCPSGNQVMPKRTRSNTPLQALNLFNSNFVLQQADYLAARLHREMGEIPERQVAGTFRLLYGRNPDKFEQEASVEMIRDQGLVSFCRAVYNTSEFLFVF